MHSLGGVRVGEMAPVRIMGILNVSPESFMKSSISTTSNLIARAASRMEDEGADFVDIGGMSTSPQSGPPIPVDEEIQRVTHAIDTVRQMTSLPISIDTPRSPVARAAFEAGAVILNDISGLRYDPDMVKVVREYRPSLVLCAHSIRLLHGDMISDICSILQESVGMATQAGIDADTISVDPAIGFFREGGGTFFTEIRMEWFKRDILMLQHIREIKESLPAVISVSNKSFIGRLMDAPDPADRLVGSLAFETMAVLNGADIVRTHNVAKTREVVQLAQEIIG